MTTTEQIESDRREFEALRSKSRRNSTITNSTPASHQGRVAELEAQVKDKRAKLATMKKQIALVQAQTSLLLKTKSAIVAEVASKPKQTLFQQYKALQKSNPAAAGAFWDSNEKAIVSGQ